MKIIKFSAVPKRPGQLLRAALALAFSVALVGCGGGGTTPITSIAKPNSAPSVTALLASSTAFTSASATIVPTANDPSSGLSCVAATGLNCVVQITPTTQTPGATVTLAAGQSIPFTASAQTLTLRVYATAANISVRIRVENSTGSATPVEAQAMTTMANAWQTLVFDFSKPVSTLTTATAAAINNGNAGAPEKTSTLLASVSPAMVDLTKVYNKVSVFFNEGKAATSETYYFQNLYFSTPTTSGLRPLNPEVLARKAVNYSPYRDSQKNEDRPNEEVTDAEVLQDLMLLKQAGFGLIRLFDSDEKVAQRVLRVIGVNTLDMKVYLGMWMAGNNEAGNKDQMARGVALANSYPDTVVAVSVGNESLINWSGHKIPVKELAANIATVRNQIKQPVTTDDNWAYYANADREILDVIDFAAVHTYAMVDTHYLPLASQWNWKQLEETDLTKRAAAMMDAAMAATKADYQAARSFLDQKGLGAMPIVIGETGWMNKDPGDGWYNFLAHPVNQKMYLDRLMAWANEGKTGAGPKNVFYFEAFDEPWKGKDDGWGLFNVARQARCAAQSLNTAANWTKEAGNCDAVNATYYKPPQLNLPVTDATLVIHSETVTGWPLGMSADAYGGNRDPSPTFSVSYPATGDSANGDKAATIDASRYIRISNFIPHSYGWGYLWQSNSVPVLTANMSNFGNGAIHFSIKTGYAGKLRIGISSNTALGVGAEAFVLVSNGDSYGYCSNATPGWCDVRIPLSAFKAANPALDLQYILTRFSISDVYSATGNADATGKPEIRLDNIYWAK
jgi:exo-beta-1,3-glucanase (GH17 family)